MDDRTSNNVDENVSGISNLELKQSLGKVPNSWWWVVVLAITATALTFDFSVPLGVAGGVPYLALVLMGVWLSKPRQIFYLAVLGSILTLIGYFASPAGGIPWVDLSNRGLALFAIWITAFLIYSRKLAEQILVEKERDLRTITSLSPDGIFRSETDGAATYVNARWLEIFGLREGDDPADWQDNLHPGDKSEAVNGWQRALAAEAPCSGEFRIVAPGGAVSWIRNEARPERDVEGKVVGYVGTSVDITELKRTEHALREQATIIDQIHESVVLADMDGLITGWNHGAERLFGYSMDDALGKHFSTLYEEQELAENLSDLKELLLKNHNHEIEARLKRQSGESFDGQVFLSLIHGPDGVPSGIVGYALDITDRKIAEQKIASAGRRADELQNRLTDAIESFSDGFMLFDVDDRLVMCNSAYRRDFASIADYLEPGTRFEDLVRAMYMSSTLVAEDHRTEEVIQARLDYHNNPKTGPWVTPMGDDRWVLVHEYRTSDGGIALVRSDITQRVIAERALAASKAEISTITNLSPVGIYRSGRGGQLTYVNARWSEITGIDRDAALNDGWIQALHPDDLNLVTEVWTNFVESDGEVEQTQVECRIVRPDGAQRYLISQAVRDYGDSGELLGYVGSITDITDRKLAEQALADSEERLSFALRGSNDGLWDWNLETGETYYSPRWSEMIGFGSNELAPDTDAWNGLLHPDDRPLIDEYMAECLEGKVASYEIEFRLRHKDGHYVDILSRGFAVPDEDGQVRRLVGVNSDISTRKRTEAALLESEEKFRAMIENTTDNITIFDQDNNYKYVSPSVIRAAGMDPEQAAEIIGSPVHNVVHRDDLDRFTQAIRQAWRQPGETIFLPEYRAILTSGEELQLEALITALPNVPGVDGVVINSRDISARKKAETDLTIAKNEAEAASLAKSQFLSSMSHELRTPMNAILGFSQLLDQDSVEPLSQRHQEFVDQILRSGHHMLELIGDVLDLAKIESDDILFDMEVQNPRPLIETCLTMIAASADQKGIDLHRQYPESDLPLIKVDALRFKQALLNLLSNAVKYNRPNGQVTLECNSGANGLIHVSVSDTGPGIPDDLRDKVFEPFDRLGAEASDTPGTGIGLTVTKQLVELMGGTVGFESTVGEGTTFWINLPVAPATSQPAS